METVTEACFRLLVSNFIEIAEFADRLKEAAYVEMYGREREANGVDARHLILPPKGYTGYRPKS